MLLNAYYGSKKQSHAVEELFICWSLLGVVEAKYSNIQPGTLALGAQCLSLYMHVLTELRLAHKVASYDLHIILNV